MSANNRQTLSLKDRLMSRAMESAAGCWIWTGAKQANGYGRMTYQRKSDYAHRWAFRAWHGEPAVGMDVCHKCDERLCINPAHLFVGTRQDNMRDAQRKGRLAQGDTHSKRLSATNGPATKLRWPEVKAIRLLGAEGVRPKSLAKAFDITSDNINRILRGDTWKE